MKKGKALIPIIICLVLVVVSVVGAVFLGGKITGVPMIKSAALAKGEVPDGSRGIMDKWIAFEPYERKTKHKDTQSIIEEMVEDEKLNGEDEKLNGEDEKLNGEDEKLNGEDEKKSESSIITDAFPELDGATLDTYIAANPECIENGYDKLFIDKVDLLNTPTGITTTLGDDVLAIDMINGIMIIGRDVVSDTGTSKVKLAVVNNKAKLDMGMVKDINYWDTIGKQATDNNAVLAVNASSYTWNEAGGYAILQGVTKWHEQMFRKARNVDNILGMTAEGDLVPGMLVEEAYNAIEASTMLIKDGNFLIPVDGVEVPVAEEIVEGNEIEEVAPAADENTEGVAEETARENEGEAEPAAKEAGPEISEIRSALTAIGETTDGKILLAVGSGGTYGSNLGVTPSELAKIMMEYSAYNAEALSGGSRTIMYWNGREVNETVDYDEHGVRLPNSFIIKQYNPETGF